MRFLFITLFIAFITGCTVTQPFIPLTETNYSVDTTAYEVLGPVKGISTQTFFLGIPIENDCGYYVAYINALEKVPSANALINIYSDVSTTNVLMVLYQSKTTIVYGTAIRTFDQGFRMTPYYYKSKAINNQVPIVGSTNYKNELNETAKIMEFVKIPGGSFMMGSNDGKGNEKPVHNVNLTSFYMMTTEVTQSMWNEIMDTNPSSHFNGNNLPVENVSWNDVQDFIKKLNIKEPEMNYRLPTEAEWEYACRAGTRTRFYSGDRKSDLEHVGWIGTNSGGILDSKTHPVGQKQPNTWGLHDMHGNVWEWCQDWKDDYPSGSVTDPRGPSNGSYRVVRGGSWGSNAKDCRSANRNDYYPSYRCNYLGFRLVREAE